MSKGRSPGTVNRAQQSCRCIVTALWRRNAGSMALNVSQAVRTALVEEDIGRVEHDSTLEEAFENHSLPVPPDGIPHEWTDVCGFAHWMAHPQARRV